MEHFGAVFKPDLTEETRTQLQKEATIIASSYVIVNYSGARSGGCRLGGLKFRRNFFRYNRYSQSTFKVTSVFLVLRRIKSVCVLYHIISQKGTFKILNISKWTKMRLHLIHRHNSEKSKRVLTAIRVLGYRTDIRVTDIESGTSYPPVYPFGSLLLCSFVPFIFRYKHQYQSATTWSICLTLCVLCRGSFVEMFRDSGRKFYWSSSLFIWANLTSCRVYSSGTRT